MSLKWSGAALTFAALSIAAAPARAQDDVEAAMRPLVFTLQPGLAAPSASSNHLFSGIGRELPVYLGVAFELQLPRVFALGLSAGAGLGWMLGATGRYATHWDEGFRFTTGAGPMLVTDTGFGTAAFAQGDAALEARSQAGFAFTADVMLAFALDSAGSSTCGVDTCSSYVRPGDRFLLFRLGIGFNL